MQNHETTNHENTILGVCGDVPQFLLAIKRESNDKKEFLVTDYAHHKECHVCKEGLLPSLSFMQENGFRLPEN